MFGIHGTIQIMLLMLLVHDFHSLLIVAGEFLSC